MADKLFYFWGLQACVAQAEFSLPLPHAPNAVVGCNAAVSRFFWYRIWFTLISEIPRGVVRVVFVVPFAGSMVFPLPARNSLPYVSPKSSISILLSVCSLESILTLGGFWVPLSP